MADPQDPRPQGYKLRGRARRGENKPFALKPSPFVMIAVVAMILVLVGIGAWHHAGALQLSALGMCALGLAVTAVALRRQG
jgi:hypothetical protein